MHLIKDVIKDVLGPFWQADVRARLYWIRMEYSLVGKGPSIGAHRHRSPPMPLSSVFCRTKNKCILSPALSPVPPQWSRPSSCLPKLHFSL